MFSFLNRVWNFPQTVLQQHAEIISQQKTILSLLTKGDSKMSTLIEAIAALQAEVAAETTVEQSAITLIKNIADQLSAVAGDPEAVMELVDQMKQSSEALAAAVLANTPAAPPAPE